MKIGVIGLGLMGGSFALDIKTTFPNSITYGFDQSKANEQKAIELGLIDHIIDYFDLIEMDIVLVSVPVDNSLKVLSEAVSYTHLRAHET